MTSKIKSVAGVLMLMAVVAWGCNEGNTDEADSTETGQNQEMEEGQSPSEAGQSQGQPIQNAAPMQQQSNKITVVTDEELEKFVMIAQQIQLSNQLLQQEMISAVEKNGLEAQRFGEIQQAQQNPNQPSNATEEEMKKFNAASKELRKMQSMARQEMQQKITEAGMAIERFEEISMTLQRDTDLQGRFMKLQQKSMPPRGSGK